MEPNQEKFEEVKTKIEALLAEFNFQLTAQAFISPDGRVFARPVIGPKPTATPSDIIV